jgi:hypothetical protein
MRLVNDVMLPVGVLIHSVNPLIYLGLRHRPLTPRFSSRVSSLSYTLVKGLVIMSVVADSAARPLLCTV